MNIFPQQKTWIIGPLMLALVLGLVGKVTQYVIPARAGIQEPPDTVYCLSGGLCQTCTGTGTCQSTACVYDNTTENCESLSGGSYPICEDSSSSGCTTTNTAVCGSVNICIRTAGGCEDDLEVNCGCNQTNNDTFHGCTG